MTLETKLLFFIIVVSVAFCVELASGTTTLFKTGPFTGIVDLGMPCNEIDIQKPVQGEMLIGGNYTNYDVIMCKVWIELTRRDKGTIDLTQPFGTSDITRALLQLGSDKESINVYEREIDSMPGAVGLGYIPEFGSTEYIAGFDVSPTSYCYIYILGNETQMTSLLKAIHISETA